MPACAMRYEGRLVMAAPSKPMRPALQATIPMMERTVVVLPMPLRPEQRRDLARRDAQRHAEQHLALAVGGLQSFHRQHRLGHQASSPR